MSTPVYAAMVITSVTTRTILIEKDEFSVELSYFRTLLPATLNFFERIFSIEGYRDSIRTSHRTLWPLAKLLMAESKSRSREPKGPLYQS